MLPTISWKCVNARLLIATWPCVHAHTVSFPGIVESQSKSSAVRCVSCLRAISMTARGDARERIIARSGDPGRHRHSRSRAVRYFRGVNCDKIRSREPTPALGVLGERNYTHIHVTHVCAHTHEGAYSRLLAESYRARISTGCKIAYRGTRFDISSFNFTRGYRLSQ